MKFISINTSTNLCSVSLYNNNKVKTMEKENVKDHTLYLAQYTREITNGSLNDLDFIVVSVGPGSFAGIRTGLSFAKGLSLAINKPIVPIDNFECINFMVNRKDKYYIAIYSHRDFVYSQLYNNNSKVSKGECTRYNELKDYDIYGNGLESILDGDYNKIVLNSRSIGDYALKHYEQLIEEKVDKIIPIYLEM